MKLDVFGRTIEVVKRNDRWMVFYTGNEGKKRAATDIIIPSTVAESDVVAYVADLCHEWATPAHPSVAIIKPLNYSRKATDRLPR